MSEESVLIDLKNLKSPDPDMKWTAINNLSKYLRSNPADFRFRMILKSFLNMVKDSDDKIRETILLTLLEVIPDTKKLEPIIIGALLDSSPGIRSLSLEWLSSQNHHSLKEQTIKALQDPAEVVRKTAIDNVLTHQIQGVESILFQMLGSEKGGLRRTVIYALGKLKTPQALGTLIDIMKDPSYDDWTRNQAMATLDHMGGRELIVPFLENLTDPNDYVRETAAAFLNKHESDMISVVMSSGRIGYIALLQHASDTTKQNFDSVMNTLKTQMDFAIKDLQMRLSNKNELNITELAEELQTTEIVTDILIHKILGLELYSLEENISLTNTGLKNLLSTELDNSKSIYLPALQENEPFKDILPETLIKTISQIPEIYEVNSDLFLTNEVFFKYSTEIIENGFIKIKNICEDIHQSPDLVKNSIVPVLVPSEDGWYNSNNEYLTSNFINNRIRQQIEQYHIISLELFLKEIGNPKIEYETLKEIISRHFQGRWLEDIQVFLEITEFYKLEQNTIRIDEERVSHLLNPINLDFPTFLRSLQKILEIKTFQAKSGQLISLESLHPLLQQKVRETSYLRVSDLMNELKFDKSVKGVILGYLTQEFKGRTDVNETFFFTEELISKIANEIKLLARINFSVLGFKLELEADILSLVIKEILSINGITNSLGEFVTETGIIQELKGMVEHRQEFELIELLDLLEIIQNRENEKLIREIIHRNNLWISRDERSVLTPKRAFNKVITFIKNPNQQIKNQLSWDEISSQTNVSKEHLRPVIEALIQNNLLPGTIDKKGYHP
ncbi:MAG: HEAT repeat domain-containing protein [Candidatus Hermodarchaeota archaeon]